MKRIVNKFVRFRWTSCDSCGELTHYLNDYCDRCGAYMNR